jgi:hypothetical protein
MISDGGTTKLLYFARNIPDNKYFLPSLARSLSLWRSWFIEFPSIECVTGWRVEFEKQKGNAASAVNERIQLFDG